MIDSFCKLLSSSIEPIRTELAPFYLKLSQRHLLEGMIERLRYDLFLIMARMSGDKCSEKELLTFLSLDYLLVQGENWPDKYAEQKSDNAKAAGIEFESQKRIYRQHLQLIDTSGEFRFPEYSKTFLFSDEYHESVALVVNSIYRFFNIMMKLDREITPREQLAIKQFWKAYKDLIRQPKDNGAPVSDAELARKKQLEREEEQRRERERQEAERGPNHRIPYKPSGQFRDPREGYHEASQRRSPGTPASSVSSSTPSNSQNSGSQNHSGNNTPTNVSGGGATGGPAEVPYVLPKAVDPTQNGDCLAELQGLIGLEKVKGQIQSLHNTLKIQQLRVQQGLPQINVALHCVYTGSPGTGKTTVARLYAGILKEMGLLSSGHLIETDRAGLVSGYMGQTTQKVEDLVQSALGGVLFIDEAYTLSVKGGQGDYGQEAINALLSRMENYRENLAVIVAGYPAEMDEFLNSNPGLRSRFTHHINFEDYGPTELYAIFETLLKKFQMKCNDSAARLVRERFEAVWARRNKTFGNGRYVRNFFESMVRKQADRLAQKTSVQLEDLQYFSQLDIPGME